MEEKTRTLSNTNPEEAKRSGWIVDAGDPNAWKTIAKAHNYDAKIMKSTKRMQVPGGWLYQVTTEGPDGYAEAITFVPDPPLEEHERLRMKLWISIAKAIAESIGGTDKMVMESWANYALDAFDRKFSK